MKLFGCKVKGDKKYIVKVKNVSNSSNCLNYYKYRNSWMFIDEDKVTDYRVKHTKKQLKDAGFGWVFSCPGIEIEEVEE